MVVSLEVVGPQQQEEPEELVAPGVLVKMVDEAVGVQETAPLI
jgi:hypothetical protein